MKTIDHLLRIAAAAGLVASPVLALALVSQPGPKAPAQRVAHPRPGTWNAINPQPLPPRLARGQPARFARPGPKSPNRGAPVSINPQPLPPRQLHTGQ